MRFLDLFVVTCTRLSTSSERSFFAHCILRLSSVSKLTNHVTVRITMALARMRAAQLYVHADDYHAHLLESRHDQKNWNSKYDRPLKPSPSQHTLPHSPIDSSETEEVREREVSGKKRVFGVAVSWKGIIGKVRNKQQLPATQNSNV